MTRCTGQPFFGSHNVTDLHQMVVCHYRQMVSRETVRFQDYEIILSVSDGFENVEQLFTLTVVNVNDLPVVIIPDIFTFEEDLSLTEDFSSYMSDEDGDDLALSVSGQSNINIEINEQTVIFTSDENWNGSENILFII